MWTIAGDKGEILVTSPAGPYLHSDSYGESIVIQLHDHAADQVMDVPWDWKDWQKELPVRARSVAELYERYARASARGEAKPSIPVDQDWPRLRDAVVRLKELDDLFEQYDARVGR